MFLCLTAFLYALPVLARELNSFIFVSEYTPSDLLSDFFSLSNSSSAIPILRFSSSDLPALRSSQPHVIFDFTYSLVYRTSLQNFAVDNQILFFSSYDSIGFYSDWVFSLHPPPSTEAQAIKSFLTYLDWTDFHLLTSESTRSRAMYSVLTSSLYELISNSADQEVFDLHASRIIKPSGNWKVVFLSEGKGASKLLWGLEKIQIFKERCGFVVSSQGWRDSKKLGTIGIVEEGLEDAQSEGEYEFKSILRALKILEDLTEDLKGLVVNNDILAERLRRQNRNNVVSEAYSIVNYQETSRIVGKVENAKVEMWGEIIFPGNVTYMNNSPPKVLVSANTGVVIDDQYLIYTIFLMTVGLQPMVYLVNNDPNILPNFELVLHETDCGYHMFEYSFTSNCMKKHFDKIGVAHIASFHSNIIKSYIALFKEFNIEVPHLAICYTDTELYDKNKYPEVLITIPDQVYFYTMLAYMIKNFRWNNIIVLLEEGFDPYQFSVFADNADILNIKILNPEDKRIIPGRIRTTYNQEVKPIIQFIRDSKCRVVIFFQLTNAARYFLEALYNAGFRRGEIVTVFRDNGSRVLENDEEFEFDREKVLEFVDGSISLLFDHYVGDYGKELKSQIAELIAPHSTSYSCYLIDALMLAVRTVDLMINAGKDYENYEELMHFMRGIRFTGCTGKVSIDSGGNGLSDIIYTITNFYVKDGIEHEDVAGIYTFGVTVPLNFTKPIIWPDGTTKIPTDLIEETKCGFPDILIQANTSSRELSGIITSGLLLGIFVLSVLALRQLNEPKIEFLKEKREMMFEDGVMLYFPLLETLQFIGLGPDFYNANFVLAFVSSLASLDFDKIIDYEFQDFWDITEATLIVASVWCFSLFFTLTFHRCTSPRFLTDFLEVVGLKMIQVFSGAGFVGINMVLFKIFKCQNGIGEDLSQSFLHNDCKTFCWEGTHLYFLIAICVGIVVFNIFAIVSKPIYDALMDYVSVKVFPLYAFAKGIFQLALVMLNLHLKDEYPRLFSVIYFLLTLVWVLILFHIDLYNYERLNSWARVFVSGVCVHQLLMVGYTFLGIPDLAVLILQLVIILGCTGLGFYLQVKKFPSMLFRKKGRNFDKLLRFALTKRVKASELTQHQIDWVIKRD